MLSNYIIPLLVLIIILYSYKKIDIYNSFIKGINEGLKLIISILPPLVAMIFAINIFLDSNILSIFKLFKIPSEILSMIIIRPLSGNASFLLMIDIIKKYGVDSNISILSQLMQGSTDTTIYVLAIYFGSIGIKNSKYALKVGLMADLIAFITAYITLQLFFN